MTDARAHDVADAIAQLRDAGVEAWDAPAIAHLERGFEHENAIAFATRLAERFDEAKATATARLDAAIDAGAIEPARVEALASTIATGDVFEALVEIDVAMARRRASSPARDAWLRSLRARAEARHLGVDDDESLVGSLLADSSQSTRAAKTIVRGRSADEDAGPYHPGALVNALLVELGQLSPSLLAARLALLDDLARVLAMTGAPLADRTSTRPRGKR